MKIVHCFFTMGMGGAQVLAIDLMNKMCTQNQISLVIVNNIINEDLLKKLDDRVRIYRVDRKEGSRNPIPLLKLNFILQRLQPDIIHLHEPDIGRIIKARVGKKLYTIHDVGIPTNHYHHFDSLVAISNAVYSELSKRYDRSIRTIYNGIDTSSFKKRNNYQLHGEKIKLVQLSRLMHEKKGQDLLLEALHLVKQHYNYSRFTLDFIGSGPSHDYLKELTVKLNLTSEVNFAGERNRDWLYEHLSDYHLLLQPSRYEGFGLTLLEGFAAGLPALASNIEGPAEIISKTPRGFLFEKNNIEDCAAKLYELFQDYEKGQIEQIMQSTIPVTEKEYSITACVEGYLGAYSDLLNERK